jgi:hypothetical protein
MTNPIQPLATDAQGVLRFKENRMVSHLLDWAQSRGMGLNEMAAMDFSQDDREQFSQLIGYSLSGYADLSYVSDATYGAAQRLAEDPAVTHMEARIAELEAQLREARDGLREPVAKLFGIHPDDLRR